MELTEEEYGVIRTGRIQQAWTYIASMGLLTRFFIILVTDRIQHITEKEIAYCTRSMGLSMKDASHMLDTLIDLGHIHIGFEGDDPAIYISNEGWFAADRWVVRGLGVGLALINTVATQVTYRSN